MARKTSTKPRSEAAQRLKGAGTKDKRLRRDIRKGLDDERRFGLTPLKDRGRSGKNARV